MSLVLSIAAHGDPTQVSLALLYPETCDDCDRPIYDRKPRQRYCVACAKARRRALERRKYREREDYRARRIASANRRHAQRRASA